MTCADPSRIGSNPLSPHIAHVPRGASLLFPYPMITPMKLLPVVTCALAALAPAQVQWTKQSPSTFPNARSNHAMVWTDAGALLFGGEAGAYLNDTWLWNGSQWKQLTPTAKPSVRTGHAMAWDPLRRRVVLFSGWNNSIYLPDTWEWDGTNWIQMSPATSPPPRDWAGMAFDRHSGKVVMFGGHDYRRHTTNGPGAWDDMWSWDGTNWTQLTPAVMAPKRFGHLMVADGVSIVVHGGGTPGTNYNDTWRWLGTVWVPLAPATLPGHRNFAASAYDASRGRIVLHGGVSGTVQPSTWEFDGTDWVQRLASGGPTVSFGSAVYDPTHRAVIAVGGAPNNNRAAPTDAIWHLTPLNPGTFTPFGSGCQGSVGTPVFAGNDPYIASGLTLSMDNLPAVTSATCWVGASNTSWGAIPLPLDLAFLLAPGCFLRVEPLLAFPMAVTQGTATLSATLPNDLTWVGLNLHAQGLALDAAANQGGFVMSNGATLVLGAK